MEKLKPWKYLLVGIGVLLFVFSDLLVNQYYSFTKSSAEATVVASELTATSRSRRGGTKYIQNVTISFTDSKGAIIEKTEQDYKSSSVLEQGQKIKVCYDPNDPNWVRIAR